MIVIALVVQKRSPREVHRPYLSPSSLFLCGFVQNLRQKKTGTASHHGKTPRVVQSPGNGLLETNHKIFLWLLLRITLYV